MVVRSQSSMSHTNVSYKTDSDTISLGDLPSQRQYKLSPGISLGRIRRTSDYITSGQHFNVYHISPVDIGQQHRYDTSLERQESNTSENNDNSYYSLQHLLERRRGERDEDSTLSRRVKRFYKDQDELIDEYERLQNQGMGNEEENNAYKKQQKIVNILTKISLGVNAVCRSDSPVINMI